jgi:hypothetical protein
MATKAKTSAVPAPYKVLWPVEHDGTRYEIGDELDVDADTAAALLSCGAIAAVAAAAAE